MLPVDDLPEFIHIDEIIADIHSQWLPIKELAVLLYRKFHQKHLGLAENAIVYLKTSEITEEKYFKLLENFFPEGLQEEEREEHSRLFNEKYKGLDHHLCEISRHPDESGDSHWVLGQSRRRVVFNQAYASIPNNEQISQFLDSHWNQFYSELEKRPYKYDMKVDAVNQSAWSDFNGEKALEINTQA